MVELIPLNYHFQEWMLKENSDNPGWEYIRSFVNRPDFTKDVFHIIVYEYRSREGCFSYECDVDMEQPNLSKEIVSLLYKNTLILMPISKLFDLNSLLVYYTFEGEGDVVDNLNTSVFASPIKWNQEINLDASDLILLIHHDGDTLFILESM